MDLKEWDNVNGLSWYPWVGKNYFSLPLPQRILLVGESHYYKTKDQEIIYRNNRYSTIECIEESAINEDWDNNTYRYLNYVLKRNNKKSNEDIWNMYAYYNFVQSAVEKKDRPSFDDFYSGWPVFIEIIETLKPCICIFIGVAALGTYNVYMEEAEIAHEKVQMTQKISRTWARKANISVAGHETMIIGIQHTSQYFAYEEWIEYIDKETKGLVKYHGE